MKKKYYGVIPPIITPILPDETVDEEGFRRLLDYCIDGGLHGIFVAGTNGETLALTQKERDRAIRIAVEHINGRVPVMAGVMDTSTRRVIDNVKAAEQAGATCCVVTPIFYDRHTSQDETVRHFEQILKETTCDLMIYNIPPFTGLKLTGKTILRIAELDKRIVGCKDSSGSSADFIPVLLKHKDDPNFSVLQGVTYLGIPTMLLGADGFVPAMAPVFPRMFANAYEACVAGDIAKSYKYMDLIAQTSQVLGMSKNATAAAKYAISLRGMTSKQVIMPQDYTLPEDEERIRAKVAEIDRAIEESGL